MVRINLLPAEIIERRKYERFYPYVVIGGVVLLALIVFSWLGLQIFVNLQSDQLQKTQEAVNNLNRQANALAIFEEQQATLENRQQVASRAVSGRVDMGKILEEVSLVLPDNVWTQELTLDQEAGVVFVGDTPDVLDADVTESYKSIAATLVRLNSLDALYDVWLSSAESDDYGDYQGAQTGGTRKVVEFEASAKIVKPAAPTQTSAVPAPPTTAGQ